MQGKTLLTAGLVIVSASVAVLFIGLGIAWIVGAASDAASPAGFYIWAFWQFLYGALALACLFSAWRRPTRRLRVLAGALALVACVTFLVGLLDVGMISGLEWALFLTVAPLFLLNWWAVRRLTSRRGGSER
jgi:peptidoglycan/LPS O-acetylase OafA/YrhL